VAGAGKAEQIHRRSARCWPASLIAQRCCYLKTGSLSTNRPSSMATGSLWSTAKAVASGWPRARRSRGITSSSPPVRAIGHSHTWSRTRRRAGAANLGRYGYTAAPIGGSTRGRRVGAGFIGLEVASGRDSPGCRYPYCRSHSSPDGPGRVGADLTIFYRSVYSLGRQYLPSVSGSPGFLGANGRVTGVETTDGRALARRSRSSCASASSPIASSPATPASPPTTVSSSTVIWPPTTRRSLRSAIARISRRLSPLAAFASNPCRTRLTRPLCRRSDRRTARTLRESAVVLERPGRSETADCRHHRWPRSVGHPRRPASGHFSVFCFSGDR